MQAVREFHLSCSEVRDVSIKLCQISVGMYEYKKTKYATALIFRGLILRYKKQKAINALLAEHSLLISLTVLTASFCAPSFPFPSFECTL